jgi:hypothetical protein
MIERFHMLDRQQAISIAGMPQAPSSPQIRCVPSVISQAETDTSSIKKE